jgi:hypothetical protein
MSIGFTSFLLLDSQSARRSPCSSGPLGYAIPRSGRSRGEFTVLIDGSGRLFFRFGRGDTPKDPACHALDWDFLPLAGFS